MNALEATEPGQQGHLIAQGQETHSQDRLTRSKHQNTGDLGTSRLAYHPLRYIAPWAYTTLTGS